MDWLAAVSSWIGSLAWPILVFSLAVLLRKPLSAALENLRHIEAPGVKADFMSGLADAEEDAEILTEDLPIVAQTSSPGAEPSGDWANDPSGVIIRAWQRLQDEVVEYANVTGLSREGRSRNVRFLVHAFQLGDLLERKATSTILELNDLRNRVAHGAHVPTAGEAITYQITAENMLNYIRFQRDHGRGVETIPPVDDSK